MQRLLFFLFFALVLLYAPSAQAGMPSAKTPPLPMQLTNLRLATPLDIASGENALQLTLDANGPVKVSATLPQPTRLQLTISGSSGAKLAKRLTADGKIAGAITLTTPTASTTVLTLQLVKGITAADYRLTNQAPNAGKPGQIILTVTKPLLPLPLVFTPGLKGKTITLDPGHGGSDPGAVGSGKTLEKNVTLAVTLQVKSLLEKGGAKVILTRQSDKDVFAVNASGPDELGARAAIGNRSLSDLFVAIHADSFSDPSVGGTGTFYFEKSPYDRLLAQTLQNSTAAAAGLDDRGIASANFFVLKRTRMPAALIELGFISNPGEERQLSNPAFQQKAAQGIVNGLQNFFLQAAKLNKKP